jgi:hypothetical protein
MKEQEATIEKKKLELPTEITMPTDLNPRDLVIVSVPKMGKGTILGALTTKFNAIVLDLERGGYSFIPARKLSTYTSDSTSKWESFQNYIKYRNLLYDNKGTYDYLIIDGVSDLDDLAEIGGTLAYMNTIIGKKFNRKNNGIGDQYHYTDPEFKSVLTLPDGAGYMHTRKWFMQQVDIFQQISPYRIYAAHIVDKLIKEDGKDEVTGSEIALTGQLKRIFASRVTTLAKLVSDGNDRYLNFDVLNDSVLSGSRAPRLKGKMLISSQNEDLETTVFWENIYK